MTEVLCDFIQHGAHASLIGHVALQQQGLRAQRLGFGGRGLGGLGAAGVVDGHIPAGFGQGQHGAAANASAAPGDEGSSAFAHGLSLGEWRDESRSGVRCSQWKCRQMSGFKKDGRILGVNCYLYPPA